MSKKYLFSLLFFLAALLYVFIRVGEPAAPTPEERLERALKLMQCSNSVYSIQEAARAGDAEVLKARLAEGFDPNLADEQGNSPLHLAAMGTSPEVVRLLLEAGADTQLKDAAGRSPLEVSVHEEVKALLAAAAAVRAKEVELDARVRSGDVQAVCRYLKEGVNPNAISANNRGPLVMSAVETCQPGTLRALLEGGAEADTRYTGTDVHVLLLAAERGNAEVINLLLAAGADPMRHANGGAYPLHNAIYARRLETVRALLPCYKAVNYNPPCKALGFPINMALSHAGDDIVKAFVDAGVNLNDRERFKDALPLIIAVRHGRVNCVKMFLAAGADKSLTDSHGKTAADYASGELAQLLR